MTCGSCRPKSARIADALRRGAVGLSKAVSATDRPSDATLSARAQTCFGTPGALPPCERLGMGLVCRACGCLAAAKIRVASESCPLGKWSATVPEDPQRTRRSAARRTPLGPPPG